MKTMLTGITSTGELTIANYLAVIKELVKYQRKYLLIIFAANLHAITQISGSNPLRLSNKELKNKTYNIIKIYAACGIDIEKNICFVQSEVSEHSELAYILTCCTTIGQLSRMTQFKFKKQKNKEEESIPTGLLIYPGLMAADILLYNPDYIPVGPDQKQHIELCRDIVSFVNGHYGMTFPKLPISLINNDIAQINSLTNPEEKMSKSSKDVMSHILLLDDPDLAAKKILRAKTDSEDKIYFDEKNKPGISNLLKIYSGLTSITVEEAGKKFMNSSYKDFKIALSLEVKKCLSTIQSKYNSINDSEVIDILKFNTERARNIAKKTLRNVKTQMGLI